MIATEQKFHNSSLRVEFGTARLKEVDEAKKKYLKAKREGRQILHIETLKPVDKFPLQDGGFVIAETVVPEGHLAGHFIDDTGDRRIIWNMRDPDDVREALAEFNKYLAKGWKPYAIDRQGNKGVRIFSFDAQKEEVVFEDKTTREKLSKFVERFKEIKAFPKTRPG